MADGFIPMEVMLFTLLALASSIFFSNVVSGLNFVASIMLFILICSNLLLNDAGISEDASPVQWIAMKYLLIFNLYLQ